MLICMHNWGSSLHLPPHRRSSIIVIGAPLGYRRRRRRRRCRREKPRPRATFRRARYLFMLFMLFMQLARSTLDDP